jgi:glycosyltransferase involved in cell wall biosynthesis
VRWGEIDILHVNRLIMADAMIDFLDKINENHVYTVLDVDDIESEAMNRTLTSSIFRPRSFLGRYLRILDLHRLRKYEKHIIPLFDACIVCSDLDRHKILRNNLSNNPWVIPNVVDTDFFKPGPQSEIENHDILFLGNMGFPPNIDAVHFFARRIFPGILAEIPTSRFIIVGKNPVESVSELADGKNVIVIGEVPDTRKYYAECSIVITPIRSGGGTRVKILEAMAMGKPIVTTSIGVEGIPASEGEEILIADKEDLFATKCVKLLLDAQLRTHIGRNARDFVRRYFDRNSTEKEIEKYYTSI